MALTDKLTAIADIIRKHTGKTGKLTFNQMATDIDMIGNRVKLINGMKLGYSTTGPSMLDLSSVTDMSYMFASSRFTTFPTGINTNNATNMSYMFYNSAIQNLPNIGFNKVTNTQGMFYECKYLANTLQVLLATVLTSNTSYMFYNCALIQVAPVVYLSKVTNMSYMFAGCSRLVSIPDSYKTYGITSKATNMQNMFSGCTSLNDSSLNIILLMCSKATSMSSTNKKLSYIGLNSNQIAKCPSLSNYYAFTAAGWSAS